MRTAPVLLFALCFGACEEIVPDFDFERMIDQARVESYEPSPYFNDGRALQTPPAHTVPFLARPAAPPPPLTRAALDRGRKRYETFCAPCHGLLGDGQTPVAANMALRPPPSLIGPTEYAVSHLVDVMGRGYGLMPSYGSALDVQARHEVAAYVRALRLSRAVRLQDLPPDLQQQAREAHP